MTRRTLLAMFLLGGLTLWVTPVAAQQEGEMAAEMEAWQKAGQPGMHHKHLAKMVGTWEAETKMWMEGPSADPMVMPATIEYRMIMDGRYLEEIITSQFMGQPFKGRGLYGFNNLTDEVEALWIDNMSTGLYTYDGTINEAGDEIALKGKYMDPVTKEWRETRSVMKISPDRLHYTSYESEDGKEQKMMEITATRKGT